MWKNFYAEIEIQRALDTKLEFDRKKAQFQKMQVNGDAIGIFNELGINEDFLLSNVSGIYGRMNLKNSTLKKAPKLKEVKEIVFGDNKTVYLSELERVGDCKIKWTKA